MEVADPPDGTLTEVGFREAVRPDGDTDAVSDTLPEKLLTLVALIVEVPVPV